MCRRPARHVEIVCRCHRLDVAPLPSAPPIRSAPSAPSQRLTGIDTARAIAFIGMALAHFAATTSPDDPGWLQAVDNSADGRAAPLFCMLLGLGAGILSARGTPDRVVVRRGLALLVLGLAIWPSVDRVYLILPHYGILLMLVPLLRKLPSRWMLPIAFAAFLVPSGVTAVLDDHGMRLGSQPDELTELLDPWLLVRFVVWTGGYPLAGWVGFAVVGLWIARRPLSQPRTQWALLLGGGVVACLQPLAAAVHDALDGPLPSIPGQSLGWAAFFDGTAHSNQTAWYVLASATAVAVVGACLVLARWTRALEVLAPLGRQALTAYLLHLLAGYWLWEWMDREAFPLTTQVAIVAAMVGVLAVFAALWSLRFRRGPTEMALRAVAG